MRTRFVVVHYHILKNAGSTIESVLEREFAAGFSTLHGPHADSVLDATDLETFLAENPSVSAVSSHHIRYPKPEIRNIVIFDFCFFRHPLDRLESLYNWARRGDGLDPLSRMARVSTSREFLRHLVNEFPHLVSNVQVMLLARGGAFTRPANEQDLERATVILHEMAVPGLVELFDESLIAAEYFLRPAFPHLRLHCEPRNVSRAHEQRRVGGEVEIENTLVERWGAGLYADVRRLNQFDLELYNRARREVERRFFLVPGLAEKARDYESRCARHTPVTLPFELSLPSLQAETAATSS